MTPVSTHPGLRQAAWEDLYRALTRRRYVGSDPVRFIYRYRRMRDRELAGWIAAALAYGNVKTIHASVERVLAMLGPNPAEGLCRLEPGEVADRARTFRHRWTGGEDLGRFLTATRSVVQAHGSLSLTFKRAVRACEGDLGAGAAAALRELRRAGAMPGSSLLASPEDGSACKRLFLFLRWMGRKDRVDPGCWSWLDPARLIMPVDTHIYRASLALGFTRRKQANLKTALEITEAFRCIRPDDPVRYDFALTRLGMHPELGWDRFLNSVRDV